MKACAWLSLLFAGSAAYGQTLALPPRASDAPTGTELVERLTALDMAAREQAILDQVTAGNVPDFLRRLCPVTVTNVWEGRTNTATFHVAPDYLAVGSDADYFLTPLTPATSQRVADATGCSLPTGKMVDAIYAAAAVKLSPAPIPPSAAMTTLPVFAAHNAIVKTQRAAFLASAPTGALVAGHKKDVVVTPRLTNTPGKVAIYGWHQTNGIPIQPLYLGHTSAWVDYSHGIRLVGQHVRVDGQDRKLGDVLADPELAGLVSDEGPVADSRYPTNGILNSAATKDAPIATDERRLTLQSTQQSPLASAAAKEVHELTDFTSCPQFGEQTLSYTLDPGVKTHINVPAGLVAATNRELLLVFYALPNGNTTVQTVGKALQPGDDWHFNIQHIGAQTRWLRQHTPDRPIAVAYLENSLKSWPAWRKQHGDALIPEILQSVQHIFRDFRVRVVLTGHSGGGSLTFGYLNTVEVIPDAVERIAFLDSNYAYETGQHAAKLVTWLKASSRHFLCVLAYHDAVALLEGKTFVSAAGGTWGRSHAMLEDFRTSFTFDRQSSGELETCTSLERRLEFVLRENPERKIYHTVQVERNGFIHALLTGTALENRDYEYFGERAYGEFIAPQ